MNSIAPVWDGNETWLVLGGGGLLAAFPLAYAIILPALYAPLIAMLLGAGLPRRRVRVPLARSAATARFWDFAFCARLAGRGASRRAITLGALLQGIDGRAAAPMPAAGGTG